MIEPPKNKRNKLIMHRRSGQRRCAQIPSGWCLKLKFFGAMLGKQNSWGFLEMWLLWSNNQSTVDDVYIYSRGRPVSRNQPKQSSKQEGILGIHIRSRSEPRAAYCPGQIIGRVPAYCVVPTFRGEEARYKAFFFPPHDLDTKSTVPVLTLSLLYKHFRTTEL